jgi:hypothetical protein
MKTFAIIFLVTFVIITIIAVAVYEDRDNYN